MRNGIKVAVQTDFTDIHIGGDNKIITQVVQGHIQASWDIQVLIQDIHTYIQLCNNVYIAGIFKEGNCTVD